MLTPGAESLSSNWSVINKRFPSLVGTVTIVGSEICSALYFFRNWSEFLGKDTAQGLTNRQLKKPLLYTLKPELRLVKMLNGTLYPEIFVFLLAIFALSK